MECPAAVAIHCCAHSLNLCLQDIGRKLICLRDALDTVREITNLICFSPKRTTLFSSLLQQASTPESAVRLKPLCPTRWTARTGTVNAIIKDYGILLEALEEIQQTTRDDHGLKAGGLLHALNQFSTLFGLKLSHLLYSAAETVSLTLQRKDITLQDALCAVEVATSYYRRLRSEE